MSLERLGRQVTGLPTAGTGEEGGEVGQLQRLRAVALPEILDLLPLTIEDRPAGAVAREVAPFAVDHDALVLAPELTHRGRALAGAHVADLAYERGRLEIQQRDVGVGRLAAVAETQSAAGAHGPRGCPVLSQGPAADIDDVDAVVPHLTVARIPEPVPLVVQLLAHQRLLGGRAAPEVVIHGARRRRGRFNRPDAIAGPVHQRVGKADGP